MNDLLSKAWKEFQKLNLITPDVYFEEIDSFQKDITLDSMELEENNFKISYSLESVGILGRIFSTDALKDEYYYARHKSKEENTLCKLLVQSEAGYLKKKNINPLDYITASVFPSGMNAIHSVLMAIAKSIPKNERNGKRFLQPITEDVYLDTNYVLHELMNDLGLGTPIRIKINDYNNLQTTMQYMHKDIIGIYYEPVSSTSIDYTDTKKIQEFANWYNIPIIVDNTTLTPYLQQQFRLGADVIIHSLSKYIGGEGDCLGGAVIGPKNFVETLRRMQKIVGNVIQSPIISSFFSRQLSNLPQRMEEHINNAVLFENYLNSSSYIESVHYPNLIKQTRNEKAGAMFMFMINGENNDVKKIREKRFLEYINNHPESDLIYKVSYGEEKHLVFGESTHGVITKAPAGLIRLASGRLPSAKEVIPHLENALNYAFKK